MALPLLVKNNNTSGGINRESLDTLCSIIGEDQFDVIVVFGGKRQGKSTFLNYMINGGRQGTDNIVFEPIFEARDSMRAITKGVYAYYLREKHVLYLDVEGLADQENHRLDSLFDIKLAASCLLLSNICFYWHGTGQITQEVVNIFTNTLLFLYQMVISDRGFVTNAFNNNPFYFAYGGYDRWLSPDFDLSTENTKSMICEHNPPLRELLDSIQYFQSIKVPYPKSNGYFNASKDTPDRLYMDAVERIMNEMPLTLKSSKQTLLAKCQIIDLLFAQTGNFNPYSSISLFIEDRGEWASKLFFDSMNMFNFPMKSNYLDTQLQKTILVTKEQLRFAVEPLLSKNDLEVFISEWEERIRGTSSNSFKVALGVGNTIMSIYPEWIRKHNEKMTKSKCREAMDKVWRDIEEWMGCGIAYFEGISLCDHLTLLLFRTNEWNKQEYSPFYFLFNEIEDGDNQVIADTMISLGKQLREKIKEVKRQGRQKGWNVGSMKELKDKIELISKNYQSRAMM